MLGNPASFVEPGEDDPSKNLPSVRLGVPFVPSQRCHLSGIADTEPLNANIVPTGKLSLVAAPVPAENSGYDLIFMIYSTV